MEYRELRREEIAKIWEIDRREVVENLYYVEGGELVLKPEHYDIPGWPPGEPERYTPLLEACFNRGGTFYGVFDDESLAAVMVLDSTLIGRDKDRLQLKLLHVSRDYRKMGLGRALYAKAVERARELGAKKLYVSATPSENTVNFYRSFGCVLADEVDEELFELEPKDVHLECPILEE